ncbi:MAG: tetratricopeptide repeat protein [Alphaproteobacteria bacterium]|nr:tetratricopeptide repeat protein [Alphaproteobacteria bacterium]
MRSTFALLGLAILLLAAGRPAAAQVAWALHVHECYTATSSETGIPSCTRALVSIALPDNVRADVYVQRAQRYLDDGRAQEAIADYTAALRHQAGLHGALVGRGIARRLARDYPGALADLDRAALGRPNDTLILLHRAATHELALDPTQARADYTAALAIDPALLVARDGRARTARALGLVEDAFADIAVSLAEEPESASSLHERGLTHLANDNLDAALEDFEATIAREPEHAEAHSNRGLVRYLRDDLDAAKQDFDRALALNPRLGAAYFNRALWWRRRDAADRARDDWLRAKEFAPSLVTAANARYFGDDP